MALVALKCAHNINISIEWRSPLASASSSIHVVLRNDFFLSFGPFSLFFFCWKASVFDELKCVAHRWLDSDKKECVLYANFVCVRATMNCRRECEQTDTHTPTPFAWRWESVSGQSLLPPLWHVVALLRSHPQSQFRFLHMPVRRVRKVWMRVSFSFYIEMIFVSSFGIHLTECNIHFGINRWTDEHAPTSTV